MPTDAGDKYQIAGQTVSCPICRYTYFSTSQTLLSTTGANFFSFDWTNPSADTFVCNNCGCILWFLSIDGEEEEEVFVIADQPLICTLCSHTGFQTRETLLSTSEATFLHVDWASPNADNYICTNCTQVLWFLQTVDGDTGEAFERAGHALTCPICHNTGFQTRETLLSSKGATFLGLDWTRPTADTFVCTNCAYIMWFS